MMLFAPAAAPGAGPPPPENLEVEGGEDTWHADTHFLVRWEYPTENSWTSIAAVHYRVRDSGGVIVREQRIGFTESLHLWVPTTPDVYKLELWLEDMAGAQGAPVAASLRFDHTPPPDTAPLPRPSWIGRNERPYIVRLTTPSAPLPISGIRGYAVSIDRSPSGDPCQQADRCSDAETDLRGGLYDTALPVAELPEGQSYVHAVAVSGSGMKSSTPGNSLLKVDRTNPVTDLLGVPAGWTNESVSLLATASDELSGMGAGGGEGPFTAIRVDEGAPTVAAGDSVTASVIGSGVHTVSYYARDAAGNVNDGGSANGLANEPPSTATVRIDREPPHVAFLNYQRPDDPEMIEARVDDSLSGPSPSRGEIAVRRAGGSDRFVALPTLGGDTLRAHWSSDAYPAGLYEFRVIAYDQAGNPAFSTQRLNGSNMVLSNPLKIPTALNAGFGGKTMVVHRCRRRGARLRCRKRSIVEYARRPSVRHLRYGRGTVLSGRLVAGARAPLPGARLLVIERFDPGIGPRERVRGVRTNANGSFVASLPPGPSREVVVVFPGSKTLARSRSGKIRMGVRSGIRLRVSSRVARIGGRPIRFRGGVLDRSGAASVRARTVQLQFRLPGRPWSEFRTLRTNANGRFRYRYRFSDDDSRGARFQFRAYVPAQKGWPYDASGSLPVMVTGR